MHRKIVFSILLIFISILAMTLLTNNIQTQASSSVIQLSTANSVPSAIACYNGEVYVLYEVTYSNQSLIIKLVNQQNQTIYSTTINTSGNNFLIIPYLFVHNGDLYIEIVVDSLVSQIYNITLAVYNGHTITKEKPVGFLVYYGNNAIMFIQDGVNVNGKNYTYMQNAYGQGYTPSVIYSGQNVLISNVSTNGNMANETFPYEFIYITPQNVIVRELDLNLPVINGGNVLALANNTLYIYNVTGFEKYQIIAYNLITGEIVGKFNVNISLGQTLRGLITLSNTPLNSIETSNEHQIMVENLNGKVLYNISESSYITFLPNCIIVQENLANQEEYTFYTIHGEKTITSPYNLSIGICNISPLTFLFAYNLYQPSSFHNLFAALYNNQVYLVKIVNQSINVITPLPYAKIKVGLNSITIYIGIQVGNNYYIAYDTTPGLYLYEYTSSTTTTTTQTTTTSTVVTSSTTTTSSTTSSSSTTTSTTSSTTSSTSSTSTSSTQLVSSTSRTTSSVSLVTSSSSSSLPTFVVPLIIVVIIIIAAAFFLLKRR